MTEKDRILMYTKIKNHGENLRTIFAFKNPDTILICKKLFSLENKANKLMVDSCNGLVSDDTLDYATEKIYNKLLFILSLSHNSPLAKVLFLNHDPRGYTLKIRHSFISENNIKIFTDWGGYGIIAPDFSTH